MSAPLSMRLDEATVAVRGVTVPRLGVSLFAALTAGLIVPWSHAAGWFAVSMALETWLWIATRSQAGGGAVRHRARANFAVSFGAICLWWLALGIMFWNSDTLAGRTCAAILVVSLVAVTILLFYSTPVMFLATGAAPAMFALIILAQAEAQTWLQLAPVIMTLTLAMIFVAGRAIETPSAQEQQRAVNDSLHQYQVLADNITDIIARTDLEGVHTYLSPAVESVLGYRPEELVGVARINLVHSEDHPSARAAVERMMADVHRREVITTRVRHKAGHWVWLQTHAKLVCEHGVPVGVIDVSRDITEQVAKDAALREAKAEAESATRAKAEFLANISHEIRTPMNGVLGALQLLESEPISPEGRELMRQAADAGLMLSQLLNDVLDFSKIEAGQLDLTPEPMDVGEALDAVMALLGGQARAKGVALRRETAGQDLWIAADPVRLRQAMFNLLGNAIKFTHQGHVTARLAVTPAADGRRHVRLEVEDTGIGIAPDAQPFLFERFRQAESSTARRFGGSGLGLSITQALARMMGGEISFTSTQGQGSTFRLDFDAPSAAPVVDPAMDDGLLEGVRILLVEDNPTNRLVARTLLTRLRAQVDEAEDGLIGLAAARDGAYDLILMDVQMPNMDGIEATRAIRALPGSAAQTPIIGLTANVMTHQQGAYRAAGMNGVVAKPIAVGALIGEIARLLGQDDTAIAV
ncbi:MAG: response regulator [Phenylobacterium sp.]|uniref:hybrid sensor histidine kinase/response regulator n=1 Tax=Phenylobacterium sp. TaxID=1871053 RepID=UPI001B77EE72|nr:ATP-binding protein [Phenylobacterium sp.]MBP7816558.1 response regulator [Phenylobacterium sp.]MBP9232072.1 response regulator [Phenylobacterium sp.]